LVLHQLIRQKESISFNKLERNKNVQQELLMAANEIGEEIKDKRRFPPDMPKSLINLLFIPYPYYYQ
jgi:hypothetical protein